MSKYLRNYIVFAVYSKNEYMELGLKEILEIYKLIASIDIPSTLCDVCIWYNFLEEK